MSHLLSLQRGHLLGRYVNGARSPGRSHPRIHRAGSRESIEHERPKLPSPASRISPALKASLPRYTQELCAVRTLLAGPDTLPALTASDRQLLASRFDRLQVEMDGCACPRERHVLHGSPHSYNVLVVDHALRFIDLETACTGPLEWDLTHIDEEGESGYCSPIDRRLLWNCRAMVSVKTATWCWVGADRDDLREHAESHLGCVKTYIASRELRDGGRTASSPEGVSGKGQSPNFFGPVSP